MKRGMVHYRLEEQGTRPSLGTLVVGIGEAAGRHVQQQTRTPSLLLLSEMICRAVEWGGSRCRQSQLRKVVRGWWLRLEAEADVGHPNNPYDMQAAKLQNTRQIQEALHQNAALEASVTAQLSQLLASTEPINTSLDRLSGLTPLIGTLQDEAQILRTHVSHTATTADRVGSRVKALDEEMRRVREAAERVAQVMELKVSSQ